MSLPELAAANLPLYTLIWVTAALFVGWWVRGVRNRAGVAVVHEHEHDTGPRGWRVYLRRAPAGGLRAREDMAQADAERLEGEL